MTAPELRGIGWAHPRCSGPLDEAARQWSGEQGGRIRWDYRSLADFNSAALDTLAQEYDLLVIDHPMVPHDAALFRPLDELASVQRARVGSVGQTGTAYDWQGTTLAVPVDVAVHVSARRSDLLADLGEPCPQDWPGVIALAERHPGKVIASLTGDDALCLLLTIAASAGQPVTAGNPPSQDAVEWLSRLAGGCPRECVEMRPPAILDLLAAGEAAYTPALFGYATYLRAPRSRLRYDSVPAFPHVTPAGLMGGAGLAVSAASPNAGAALAFIDWIISPPVQRDVLLAAGGQPAARVLWEDPAADELLGGFLSQTRQATEAATIRPRDPRWPEFHRRGADILEKALSNGRKASSIQPALASMHADVFTPGR